MHNDSTHPPDGTRIVTVASFLKHRKSRQRPLRALRDFAPRIQNGLVPTFDPTKWPADERAAGLELARPNGKPTFFVPLERCGGCSAQGKCLLTLTHNKSEPKCWCVFGAVGDHCEKTCSNDCINDCSFHGRCVHGFCVCDPGFYGIDCSSNLINVPRSTMPGHPDLFSHGAAGINDATNSLLPPSIKPLIAQARRMIYVYDLPPHINRRSSAWSNEYWGKDRFRTCAPVFKRRVYQAQAHFDAHLLHDDFVRTLDPTEASLFYVPTMLLQRTTWGAKPRWPVLEALNYIRSMHPFWNASGGKDHVWFFFHENHCALPDEVKNNSILVSSWGGSKPLTQGGNKHIDCMTPGKDVVVPTVTPMSHDRRKVDTVFRAMFDSATERRKIERSGPLLFFAGGVVGYGAAQENYRQGGKDSQSKSEKLLRIVSNMRCADPNVQCRNFYSMGVRQAVWREKLWADKDVQLVSAGRKDYAEALLTSRFCLHTEGNGWGTRIVDYAMAECVPVIINDDIMFIFQDIIPYSNLSLHFRKAEIPRVLSVLRSTNSTSLKLALGHWRRAFSWWRPLGLAYEFTIANLVHVARARDLLKEKGTVGTG